MSLNFFSDIILKVPINNNQPLSDICDWVKRNMSVEYDVKVKEGIAQKDFEELNITISEAI